MSFWVQMTVDTFRDPKRTAEKIIQWQITKTELYLAMIAFSAVNAFLAGLSSIISPLSVDPAALESMPILALMKMPLILFVLIVTGLIISIHGFFLGRVCNGRPRSTQRYVGPFYLVTRVKGSCSGSSFLIVFGNTYAR